MVKVICIALVVSPDVILAIRTTILVVVGIAHVWLVDMVNHLAVQYASASDYITTLVAQELVGMINAFL